MCCCNLDPDRVATPGPPPSPCETVEAEIAHSQSFRVSPTDRFGRAPGFDIGRHVAIVGGGATGALLTAHFLQRDAKVRVTLIEQRDALGRGIAYGSRNPLHLMNTRSRDMSAFQDDPDHFLRWLAWESGISSDRDGFVDRETYGRYLAGLIPTESPSLRCCRGEVVAAARTPDGALLRLADGQSLEADIVVLATGHALPRASAGSALSQPWSDLPCGLDDGPVLLVGTGLTMVDQALSLLACDVRFPIIALSRRGVLPQVHAAGRPLPIDSETLPDSAAELARVIRAMVRAHMVEGGDWRAVVDGLRPHLRSLWLRMPLAARSSFVRHGAAWWDLHRHRMPPSSAKSLAEAAATGRLVFWRGCFVSARRAPAGDVLVTWRDREGRMRVDAFARAVDCRGIRRDPETHATPLIRRLLDSGAARIDPLRLGLDVAPDCRLRAANGSPQSWIYAAGPASRAAFWEITAIPDIRAQVSELVASLLATS
jgi:uncharacterized NAD(P)/FAD-binding protein YdhS